MDVSIKIVLEVFDLSMINTYDSKDIREKEGIVDDEKRMQRYKKKWLCDAS